MFFRLIQSIALFRDVLEKKEKKQLQATMTKKKKIQKASSTPHHNSQQRSAGDAALPSHRELAPDGDEVTVGQRSKGQRGRTHTGEVG